MDVSVSEYCCEQSPGIWIDLNWMWYIGYLTQNVDLEYLNGGFEVLTLKKKMFAHKIVLSRLKWSTVFVFFDFLITYSKTTRNSS